MIRSIQNKDKTDVFNMMKEFYSSPAVLHKVDENNFLKTIDEALNKSPYVEIFVYELSDKLAGYCQISLSYSNEAGGLTVYIEELMIKTEYQNMGYGKEFLNFILSFYKDAKRFRLEVTKENQRAIRLYEKTGFKALDYTQMIIDK